MVALPRHLWTTRLDVLALRGGALISSSCRLAKRPSICEILRASALVDVVFLAMLVDVINWLGVMAGLTVINVFSHDLLLPYKERKNSLEVPGPTLV
jgi:hypothetical protein